MTRRSRSHPHHAARDISKEAKRSIESFLQLLLLELEFARNSEPLFANLHELEIAADGLEEAGLFYFAQRLRLVSGVVQDYLNAKARNEYASLYGVNWSPEISSALSALRGEPPPSIVSGTFASITAEGRITSKIEEGEPWLVYRSNVQIPLLLTPLRVTGTTSKAKVFGRTSYGITTSFQTIIAGYRYSGRAKGTWIRLRRGARVTPRGRSVRSPKRKS